MKTRTHSTFRMITLVAGLALVAGCVRTLHPLYTAQDVAFRETLLGTWKQTDGDTTWQFTKSPEDGPENERDQDQAYRLVLTDGKGRPGTFLAHLVELDDRLFLDLFPVAPNLANNGFYKLHYQPVHTFLRVQVNGESLQVTAMNPKWLESYLQEHPDALPHERLGATGHPAATGQTTSAERLLVTASTEQLQQFVVEHASNSEAFGKPTQLTAIP